MANKRLQQSDCEEKCLYDPETDDLGRPGKTIPCPFSKHLT